jgi:DNA-binding NarL/FixJ family response regulator
LGFELDIHEAPNNTAVPDQLRSGGFELGFLDYIVPGLKGADILLGIKRENSHVAVVLMTSALIRGTAGPARIRRARPAS